MITLAEHGTTAANMQHHLNFEDLSSTKLKNELVLLQE